VVRRRASGLTMGGMDLRIGDRIQVKYDLVEDDGEVESTVWWGAQVKDIQMAPDGRRIYRLLYDAYPEGGSDEAEERSVQLGDAPDQIWELDDHLRRTDQQTFRMEPPDEKGVWPANDDDTAGYQQSTYATYASMNPQLQWYSQHAYNQQQQMGMDARQHASSQAHNPHAGQQSMQQVLLQLQLQAQRQQQAGQYPYQQ